MAEDTNASICGACRVRCLDLHPRIKNLNLNGFSFFKVMEGDFSSFLEIPIPFKLEKEDEIGVVLMGHSGQLWTVKLCVGYGELAILRDGWENFSSDHSLSKGDVVVFNRICNTRFVVQVFGSNGHEKYNHRVENKSCVPEKEYRKNYKQFLKVGTDETKRHVRARKQRIACNCDVRCQETDLEKVARVSDFSCYHTRNKMKETALEQIDRNINGQRVASELANRLVGSRNPNFGKWLTDGAVTKGYRLSIPREYRKILRSKIQEVILSTHDDRSYIWTLKVASYDRFYGFHLGGWKRFVEAHNLKKGDICVFELVDADHFMVYIQRLEDQR